MLVVFAGLPCVGKTTIARTVAARRMAVFLRIDEIEQAIRSSSVLAGGVGVAGYAVAQALASSNLAIGCAVVADCVNPVRESRDGWRRVAAAAGVALLEVEVVCSDAVEHRRRVEQRRPDIAGHALPSWADVLAREYQPWDRPRLLLDTAHLDPASAAAAVGQAIAGKR